MHLSNLIRGVHRSVEDFIAQRIKASGLSVEQYRILEALHQEDGRSMGSLAAAVFVDSPTLTKIVDRMVTSSLVYRAPDSNDRRKVLIFTAQKGAKVFKGLSTLEEELQSHLAQLLGQGALDQLARTLDRILEEGPGEAPAQASATGSESARAGQVEATR